MYCNTLAGFVDLDCMTHSPGLGNQTISQLLQQAITSLAAHPYTPKGSPWRAEQEALKSALDAANNNLNWGAQ
jgi:hypothetical protein